MCAACPGRLRAVLGCTWLRPPAGTAVWLFGFFFFSVVTQKVRRAPCTVCCLVCNSVQVCSRTARSSELPHLLPPCGARCALVQGNWCWLETSSHVLFGLPSHRALATAALSARDFLFCVTFGLSAHSLRLPFLSRSSGWCFVLVFDCLFLMF